MSNLVQVLATATQFPSQLGGGLAPGETPHDQDEHRRAVVCSLKHRPGPGIEDPSTCRAAIIEDGLTKGAMDLESLPGQGNSILTHVLSRTFSLYSSFKAHLSRLVSIP